MPSRTPIAAVGSNGSGNVLAASKLSGKKIDAIIANNDEMALGAVKAIQAAGIKAQ